ncbi:MAG: hypothetical protein U1D30_19475 [Planctomycetota bacterium]
MKSWTETLSLGHVTVQALLLLMAYAATDALADGPDQIYEKARTQFLSGELDEALESFRLLSAASPPWSAIAAYGKGNCLVRKAIQPSLAPNTRNSLLGEAIDAYRIALDSPEQGILPPEDVRHNLELAKRLRVPTENLRGSRKRKPDKDDRLASSEDRPSESETVTMPDLGQESDLDESSATTKDEGKVEKAKGGSPFVDPGEWSAAQAKRKLDEAVLRIEKTSAQRLKSIVPQRRRATGDY